MGMRRIAMLSVTLLAALALAGPSASAEQMSGKKSYVAHMTGDQEVSQKGPSGAKGTAKVDVDAGAGQVCYELTYEGVGKLAGGHIHKGAKGVEGDPVVNLDPAKNGDKACVAGDKAKLKEIDSTPGGYYVNLHTADYKMGAMRGQLEPAR
jgi:CHRD domain-containing protein